MQEFSSPTITNLAKALLTAQEQISPVTKDATNPFLKNRYASLVAVLEAVRRPLLDNGILLIQRVVESEPGTAAVETRLLHTSGEWVAGVTTIPLPETEPGSKTNMGQAVGAAISYARRYGLMAMLSMAAVDEDTDNEVRNTQPQTYPQHRLQQPQSIQQHTDQPSVTTQDPAGTGTTKSIYPGLPTIPDVTYEESKDIDGRDIVIATGKTLIHKDALKKVGFRWSPERKSWWIAA
jgi:hypothetical protein